jgi:hypothetical protein
MDNLKKKLQLALGSYEAFPQSITGTHHSPVRAIKIIYILPVGTQKHIHTKYLPKHSSGQTQSPSMMKLGFIWRCVTVENGTSIHGCPHFLL